MLSVHCSKIQLVRTQSSNEKKKKTVWTEWRRTDERCPKPARLAVITPAQQQQQQHVLTDAGEKLL